MRQLLPTLIFLSIVNPAFSEAQVTYWATAGKWIVMSDNTVSGSCFAYTDFVDGTRLRFGFLPKGSKFPAYIAFTNERWLSVEAGKDYPVTLQFDQTQNLNFVASGWTVDGKKGVLINYSDTRVVEDLVKKRSVALLFKSTVAANLSLEGSVRAMQEAVNCERSHDNTKTTPPSVDPFAQPNTTTKIDPFQL